MSEWLKSNGGKGSTKDVSIDWTLVLYITTKKMFKWFAKIGSGVNGGGGGDGGDGGALINMDENIGLEEA